MALISNGFLEGYDEVEHYLYARHGWSNLGEMLSLWARIGCTAIFGLGAPFGLRAARMVAVVITGLVGIGTGILATDFVGRFAADFPGGRRSFLARHRTGMAWLLLFAQPFFVLNCFTVMTEMLQACAWVWGAAALVLGKRRMDRGVLLAGFFLGLGGLMRPEGWVAIACWPAFCWMWLRRPAERPVLPMGKILRLVVISTGLAGFPPLAWYLAGAIYQHNWMWVITYWPWPAISQYGKTGGLFLASLGASLAWLWVPVLLTIGMCLRRRKKGPDVGRDALLLLAAPVVGMYLMHGFLGTFGLMGSLSLPRYFICIAPMAAVLALAGLIRIEAALPRLRWLVPAVAIVLVITQALGMFHRRVLPTDKNLSCQRMDVVAAEVKRRLTPAEYSTRLIAAHPYLNYALDLPPEGPWDIRAWDKEKLAHAPVGTLLVLEHELWASGGLPSDEQLEAWGFQSDAGVAAATDAIRARSDPLGQDFKTVEEKATIRMWVKER